MPLDGIFLLHLNSTVSCEAYKFHPKQKHVAMQATLFGIFGKNRNDAQQIFGSQLRFEEKSTPCQ